jgi:tetratricopeptide (TPR) repeat protein
VLDALGRAETLYNAHDGLPPPGFGTDPLAIRAMVAWGAGRYRPMADLAAQAEQLPRSRHDALGEAFALWLHAAGLNRTTRLLWHANPDRSGRFSPADDETRETLADAVSVLDRATSLLTELGESWFLSFILAERTLTSKAQSDNDGAMRLVVRMHAARERFGDTRGVADALVYLADTCIDRADADGAMDALERAEPIVQRLGDLSLVSEWDRARGLIDWLRGDAGAALERFARVAELSMKIGNVNNVIAALRGMGDVYVDLGQFQVAAEQHAFVAGHPATMPFSRARAETAIDEEATHLGHDRIDEIRERMRTAHLPLYTAECVERIRAGVSAG